MWLIKIQNNYDNPVVGQKKFFKNFNKTPVHHKKPKKFFKHFNENPIIVSEPPIKVIAENVVTPMKILKKKFKLSNFFILSFQKFQIIINVVWGLFNLHNRVFLKTINFKKMTYWTLFGYSTEKYYCLKNSNMEYSNTIFLKLSPINNSREVSVGNLISLKKANVGFDLPYKHYKNFITSFLDSTNIMSKEDRLGRPDFMVNFLEEEEDFETNVWIDNSFRYKTKLLITKQRLQLVKFFKFKLKRQYRITPWISNFLKWKVRSIISWFDLMLINVILNTKLVLHSVHAEWFIKRGFIYVNGVRQTKTNYVVKQYDIIQIVYSPTYVNFFSNYFNFLFKASNKFVNKFSRKISEQEGWDLGYYLNWKTRIPKLFNRVALFRQPIPYYFEVDFLTFSAFVVYLPVGFNFILNSNFHFYNYYLARLYNWKFRT